jgi:dipeptide/tripeptide permease
MIKSILLFLAAAIGGKIVRDTLPPVGLQHLWMYSKRFVNYLAVSTVILMAIIMIKYLSRDGATEQEKERALALAFCILLLAALDFWLKRKREEKAMGVAI